MNKYHQTFQAVRKWVSNANVTDKDNYFWSLSTSQFIFLIAAANIVLYNIPLNSFVISKTDILSLTGISILLTINAVVVVLTIVSLFTLAIALPILIKPFCILIALINSVAIYFFVTYQVILDWSMIGNIFNTRSTEAIDFLHPMLIIYLIVLGVIPGWLLLRIRIEKIHRLRLFLHLLIGLVLGSGLIYINSTSWLWIDKYAKILGGKVLPWSYIMNSARYYSSRSQQSQKQELLPPATFANDKKMVVVLILGESARAENFSLYGYGRETNPLLEKSGVTVFNNTRACATYTTASIACILSFDGSNSATFEPLPSYLYRHGVDVIWRTMNWGEPHINVSEYQDKKELKKECVGEYCDYDELLLDNLDERILSSTRQKIFIVLHSKGSHGPSYHSRYPEQYEKFKPVCKSVELNKCTQQELINAYDNTILYTDHFLNETIETLKKLDDIPTLMLYISDHGESLGEYGVYLHGTPNYIAPDFQIKIPFIMWMSKKFIASKGYGGKSLKQENGYSDANIFHSVMGAFNMNSDIYDNDLDVFNSVQ